MSLVKEVKEKPGEVKEDVYLVLGKIRQKKTRKKEEDVFLVLGRRRQRKTRRRGRR